MARLRTIVDEKDARACLSAAARSGETLREWAREHGVDGRSLHAWQRNLARRVEGSPREPRLVELVPVERGQPRAPGRQYVVRVGDAAIEVGDDFDADTLRRLIEVVREC